MTINNLALSRLLVYGSLFLGGCEQLQLAVSPRVAPGLQMDQIRNESFTHFTTAEITQAYSFILPEPEAKQLAADINRIPEKGEGVDAASEVLIAPTSYDGDFLDLMSLVSPSCADRAWRLMRISPSEGSERRLRFVKRIESILRVIPKL
jgi:hypothetical protein